MKTTCLKKFFFNILIAVYSIIAAVFLLLGTIEIFPALLHHVNLSGIPYYAIRQRYVFDDELIFKYPPFKQREADKYRGELYAPDFGVEVAPVLNKATIFDENGFRNAPHIRSSDIVVIGDSYIETGEDDTDTFAARIERISGKKTYNLGIGWYGPPQYGILLERYGLAQKPKYALFCFFEGNDIKDIREYIKWTKGEGYYKFKFFGKNFFQRFGMALKSTYVCIYKWVKERTSRKITAELPIKNRSDLRLAAQVRLNDKIIKTVFLYFNDPRPPGVLLHTPEYAVLKVTISTFVRNCRENGIFPVVIFIPTQEHVYAEYTSPDHGGESWLKIRGRQIAARDNMENALRTLCQGTGVTLISLTPLFETLAKEGKFLYYPFDTHWNSEAREAAAEYVVRELGIIPPH